VLVTQKTQDMPGAPVTLEHALPDQP
jgi:hypothetical protein